MFRQIKQNKNREPCVIQKWALEEDIEEEGYSAEDNNYGVHRSPVDVDSRPHPQ